MADPGLLIFFVLISVGVSAVYTSAIAGEKGHRSGAWFFGGLLFGPIALLASIGLPDLKARKYLRLIAERQGVDLSGEPGVVHEGDNWGYTYWESYKQKPKP